MKKCSEEFGLQKESIKIEGFQSQTSCLLLTPPSAFSLTDVLSVNQQKCCALLAFLLTVHSAVRFPKFYLKQKISSEKLKRLISPYGNRRVPVENVLFSPFTPSPFAVGVIHDAFSLRALTPRFDSRISFKNKKLFS